MNSHMKPIKFSKFSASRTRQTSTCLKATDALILNTQKKRGARDRNLFLGDFVTVPRLLMSSKSCKRAFLTSNTPPRISSCGATVSSLRSTASQRGVSCTNWSSRSIRTLKAGSSTDRPGPGAAHVCGPAMFRFVGRRHRRRDLRQPGHSRFRLHQLGRVSRRRMQQRCSSSPPARGERTDASDLRCDQRAPI